MTRPRPANPELEGRKLSMGRVVRGWPKLVLGLWLLAVAIAGIRAHAELRGATGGVESLLPLGDRSEPDEFLVLLTLRPEAEQAMGSDIVLEAAATLAEQLGAERVPFVPPAGEAEAWVDRHGVYLVPDEALDTLQARLADDAMTDTVEGLRARMSSPLFGVSGEEPRRDPLGLAPLTRPVTGGLGTLGGLGRGHGTAAGDLATPQADAVLIQIRSERSLAVLEAEIRTGLESAPVDVSVVGPAHVERVAQELVRTKGPRLAVVGGLMLLVVLALALRRVRATTAIVACVASGVVVAIALGPQVDLWTVAMLVLLAGFSCEGALHLQRVSVRGWPAALVLATALLPLCLSPYPAWQRWGWTWAICVAAVLLILRVVLPSVHRLVGGAVSWRQRGAPWRVMPPVAATAGILLLGAGLWAVGELAYRGADRVPLHERVKTAGQVRLVDDFFDPNLVVRTDTRGADEVEAMVRGSEAAHALTELIPDEVAAVDSPATLVLRDATLQTRKAALARFDLPLRLQRLSEILQARGFRPDAFGEFLRSAGELGNMPTAAAVLEGPLGTWARSYFMEAPEGAVLRSVVHLPPGVQRELPRVWDVEGRPIEFEGPAAAARVDRLRFGDWLGIYTLCQLWVGAFVVWLGTRSFAIAITAAFAALATQCGTLAGLALLQIPLGPTMLPGLLLVGAAAIIAASRACRGVDLRRPVFARGVLVTSLCQLAAAAALVATDVDVWRELGLVVGLGAVLASGVGLFVAPGVCQVLRRAARVAPLPPPTREQEDAP